MQQLTAYVTDVEIYELPESIELFVMDIDNTLYRNDEYYRGQIELLLERYARHAGLEPDQARRKLEEARKELSAKNGGKKTSMGNTMVSLGVSLEENARWRSEMFEPERYLNRDNRLREALRQMGRGATMIAVTNNSRSIGIRTLDCLGVGELFEETIGLDTTVTSKPSPVPFQRALEHTGIAADHAVSVGDRYDVDIATALQLGMGGIVVDSMDDVYRLPDVLGYTSKS